MGVKPVVIARFKCCQCGAKDSTPLFENEQAPQAVVCWNCHKGKGIDAAEQFQRRIGMCLVSTEPIVIPQVATSEVITPAPQGCQAPAN